MQAALEPTNTIRTYLAKLVEFYRPSGIPAIGNNPSPPFMRHGIPRTKHDFIEIRRYADGQDDGGVIAKQPQRELPTIQAKSSEVLCNASAFVSVFLHIRPRQITACCVSGRDSTDDVGVVWGPGYVEWSAWKRA